jgi:F0F1-type ATP synthase assembly protein I
MAGGEPKQGKSSEGYRYLGLGMELAAAVAGLTLLGYWIDRHFDTAPWGVLIGVATGLVGGLYNLVKTVVLASASTPGSSRKPDRGAGPPSGGTS